jgi:hypothetical protein
MQSLSIFFVGSPKRMDVFSAPEIGSAEAIQGRGSTAGTSTDIIYPVSKLVKGQFQPGRTLEFNWKSSPERWWHPKSTRLVVHYKACFGEVDSTCRDASTGPTSSNGVRPSKSVSLTPLPNTSLFGTGQVRYTNNGVVCENSNHLYDQSMVQLLLTQNAEAGQGTSASNMLTDLSKSSGLPNSTYFDGSFEAAEGSEAYAMLPVVRAPYYTAASDGTQNEIDGATNLGEVAGSDTFEGKEAIITLTSGAANSNTFVVSNEFAAVLQVNDTLEVATAGAHDYSLQASTKVASIATATSTTKTITMDKTSEAASGSDTRVAEAGVTQLKVTGAAFDAEKMTMDSLASGLAVKVKGDTFKRSGLPNSRFEILQQGYVEATGDDGKTRGHCEVQVSEPVMLSTWSASNYCQGPGDNSLFLTVSPDFAKNLFYDHSGEYAANDAAINCSGTGSDDLLGDKVTIPARQIAVSVESVELHVSYIHPSTPYIPKSISIRWAPIQVTTRKMRGQQVNESFVVPPSTKSVLLFMRQAFQHICADRAELSLAGGGVNIKGTKHTWTPTTSSDNPATGGKFTDPEVVIEKRKQGKFLYDNQKLLIDPSVDPRLKRPISGDSTDKVSATGGVESTRPYAWQSLQVQLGSSVQPREMLTDMKPQEGKMSRLFNLYLNFIGRSQGYRGSAMSYSEFCSYHNSNYASGPLCGDRGAFAVFDMEQPPGSIATDLQVRGTLLGSVESDADQELVCVAVSDSIWNVGFQSPSATPVMTQVAPILS